MSVTLQPYQQQVIRYAKGHYGNSRDWYADLAQVLGKMAGMSPSSYLDQDLYRMVHRTAFAAVPALILDQVLFDQLSYYSKNGTTTNRASNYSQWDIFSAFISALAATKVKDGDKVILDLGEKIEGLQLGPLDEEDLD